MRRRHQEASNLNEYSEVSLVGAPDQGPLVTRAQGDEDSVIDGFLGREYAGGWVVAHAREEQRGRRAWILVTGAPERFAAEVLPQFGDRTGLEPGSLRILEQPEPVPTEGPWLINWVKDRAEADSQESEQV